MDYDLKPESLFVMVNTNKQIGLQPKRLISEGAFNYKYTGHFVSYIFRTCVSPKVLA